MTVIPDDIAPDAADSYPSWCVGCDEGEAHHATEFEGPNGMESDTDAIVRLVQEHGGPALVELGVNDADGDSACIRLSLEQATELADLLNGLISTAEAG